jgi:hypothetical protein
MDAVSWKKQINAALKREKKWRDTAKDTDRRYRGDSKNETSTQDKPSSPFNILYSNTETLRPALYARTPVPDIRTRWPDLNQPVVKTAARMLERSTSYALDAYDFDGVMQNTVSDYVLAGRGTARIKYERDQQTGAQKAWWEFVPWEDFCHSKARYWSEVTWVAFRSRPLLVDAQKRFDNKTLKPDSIPEDQKDEKGDEVEQHVTIWEIWDEPTRTTVYVAIDGGNEIILDENTDDPLSLDNFFPCPRPLISVKSTNTLLPKPEFLLYKRQADELEMVTERTEALADAIKARGGYAGKMSEDFGNILDSEENTLVALNNVEALVMNGGDLSKLVWMWPIEVLAAVLQIMTGRIETIKQTIYEITGISDILRGSSDPNETATAQSIKANYGGQRVGDRQKEVQRFCRDLIRLNAEVVGELFEPDTLIKMTGMQLQPEEMSAVIQLLRNDLAMSCVIDIETDSTIAPDIMLEQERATAFAQGMGQLSQAILPLMQAGMPQEIAVEMLKGQSAKYKMGRALDDALDKWGQTPPPPPQPSPEAQYKQGQLANETKKTDADIQLGQQKHELEVAKFEHDKSMGLRGAEREDAKHNLAVDQSTRQGEMDAQRFEFEQGQADKSNDLAMQQFAHTKRSGEIARRDANRGVEGFEPDMMDEEMKQVTELLGQFFQMMQQQNEANQQAIQAMVGQLAQGQQQIAQAMMTPKRIVYDKGRPVGSEPVAVQ